MIPSISVEEKKAFIQWFLRKYNLKRREAPWILDYIKKNDKLLEKIHFVEDAHFMDKALILSTTDSDGIPFRYYKGKLMTADAEVAFKNIRDSPDEELYIQLNFKNKKQCPEYMAILEENDRVPDFQQRSKKDSKIAEEFLDNSIKEFQNTQILKGIDKALDDRDKETFIELTDKLKRDK